MSDSASDPHIYLLTRCSKDCAPQMLEILGAYWQHKDAMAARDCIFEEKQITANVLKIWIQGGVQ